MWSQPTQPPLTSTIVGTSRPGWARLPGTPLASKIRLAPVRRARTRPALTRLARARVTSAVPGGLPQGTDDRGRRHAALATHDRPHEAAADKRRYQKQQAGTTRQDRGQTLTIRPATEWRTSSRPVEPSNQTSRGQRRRERRVLSAKHSRPDVYAAYRCHTLNSAFAPLNEPVATVF